MLKYVYVSPSDFLVVLLGRGVARSPSAAMGAADHARVSASLVLGVPFDIGAVNWPLFAIVMTLGLVSIIAIGVLLARDLPPDAPGVVVATRRRSAGALFLVSGAIFPIARPALGRPGDRAADAAQLVDRGRPAVAVPGRHRLGIGGTGSLFETLTGQAVPDAAQIVVALLVTGTVATLARDRRLPGERPARQGPRAAGPDDGLLIEARRVAGRRRS